MPGVHAVNPAPRAETFSSASSLPLRIIEGVYILKNVVLWILLISAPQKISGYRRIWDQFRISFEADPGATKKRQLAYLENFTYSSEAFIDSPRRAIAQW